LEEQRRGGENDHYHHHGSSYLGDETVEVGISGPLNIEVTTAGVIEGLIIQAEGHISVLQEGMGGQHGVVWLHHSSSHLYMVWEGRRRDGRKKD